MASSVPPADAHRFDHTVARARAQVSACAAAAEALAGLRGRATSADGAVVAVVDGRGALVSLELAEPAVRLPAARLGALIVETTHAARRAALLQRQAVLHDLGTDLGR